VWAPCMLFYRTYPSRLLRKARQGDADAMEMLLRIDKGVVADPKIAEQLHQMAGSGWRAGFGRMGRAFLGTPKRMTRKQIKVSLAGLLSETLGLTGQKLTAPEIRRVFDAASRDFGRSRTVDPDLPPGDWAFAKAVERRRDIAGLLPQSDKNKI